MSDSQEKEGDSSDGRATYHLGLLRLLLEAPPFVSLSKTQRIVQQSIIDDDTSRFMT